MKIKLFPFQFLVLISLSFCTGRAMNKEVSFNEDPRQTILFNFEWKFHRGDTADAELPEFDDSDWRVLQLPHDWSIEDLPGKNSPIDAEAVGGINTGYYTGGTGWYRKSFFVPDNLEGRVFNVMFEGVYMNADVWINGIHLGNHPYGYTSFELDLTEHIQFGQQNLLAVQVKNEGRNSRWYSGSGIYRNVWLSVANPVHFATWGVAITTPEVATESATVELAIDIVNRNQQQHSGQISGRIYDPSGKEVAVWEDSVNITAGTTSKAIQMVQVVSPRLWSPDAPELYKVVMELKDATGRIIDEKEEFFGIRTIEFSVENGFMLNGKSLLLKGGCMHHDNGPLGAAAYDRAEERRVELMKANGFNAIRSAHNPPSVAFLNACDRLGVLVINEAFDMWRKPKNPQDYHLYFDDNWKKDIEAMVLRDMNHPSVIMWSTGNEISERGEPEGAETSEMLAGYVRQLDPTRPVTAAVNGLNPNKDPYFATLDVSGYNYS